MSNPSVSSPAAIRSQETAFLRLVQCIRDYAIILLDPSGNVMSWNQGAEVIKGYRPEEILGKHFSCFYPADVAKAGYPEKELAIALQEGRFEDENWRIRKNGDRFWANVVIIPLRGDDGELIGYGKITRDLSQRKQIEWQLEQQAKEIQELATPVMQVWNGVVVAPLIGSLDSRRTQQFMERLLERIVETNSSVALVDILGVPTIDTQTAQHLIETITAVRLLGSQVVLTGVRPAIAQTIVHLGLDLSGIETRSSLASGLQVALDFLKLKVVPLSDNR